MSLMGHHRRRHFASHRALTTQDERAIQAQVKRMRHKQVPAREPDEGATLELRGIELDRRGLVAAMLMGKRVIR